MAYDELRGQFVSGHSRHGCPVKTWHAFQPRFCDQSGLYGLPTQSVHREISRRGWLAVQPRKPTIVCTSDSGHGTGPYAADYETIFGGKGHVSATNPDESGFTTLCKDERDGLARATVACLARSHDHPFSLVASFVNPHDICHLALREHFSTLVVSQEVNRETPRDLNGMVPIE